MIQRRYSYSSADMRVDIPPQGRRFSDEIAYYAPARENINRFEPRLSPPHAPPPQHHHPGGNRRPQSPSPAFRSGGLLKPHPHSFTRPLLVLDLDETLVHASVEKRTQRYHFSFVVNSASERVQIFVLIRPFVEDFLRRMSQLFEVCLFTASTSEYADIVIDRIDPNRQWIHHRLFRQHCTMIGGDYVKDLSRLGRPLHRLCLLDNSPVTYSLQPENGFPIESWFGNPHDNELLRLAPCLEHFSNCGNFFETSSRFRLRR